MRPIQNFTWTPGNGCCLEALSRIRDNFRRPSQPMGEAWFMGNERHMYTELFADIDVLPAKELVRPLEAIISGTNSFGYYEEWNVWYHYLLGRLLFRCHERWVDYLLEFLVGGFITQHPDGIEPEPYSGFRLDALNRARSRSFKRV